VKITETSIEGLVIIEQNVFKDERGWFQESYNANRFKINGLSYDFVQDNESFSQKGVVRGLHYQLDPYAQAKLVRVIKGSAYDVAIDLREGSPTFLKQYGILLTEENKKQFLVPRGFAHGFVALENDTLFSYKCDNYYNKESEGGINCLDEKFNIDWQLDKSELIISEKDAVLPIFEKAKRNFTY